MQYKSSKRNPIYIKNIKRDCKCNSCSEQIPVDKEFFLLTICEDCAPISFKQEGTNYWEYHHRQRKQANISPKSDDKGDIWIWVFVTAEKRSNFKFDIKSTLTKEIIPSSEPYVWGYVASSKVGKNYTKQHKFSIREAIDNPMVPQNIKDIITDQIHH